MGKAAAIEESATIDAPQAPEGADLIEWYYERGYSDGFPLVPPTPQKIAAVIDALGGDHAHLVARVPPRWGNLTREVLCAPR